MDIAYYCITSRIVDQLIGTLFLSNGQSRKLLNFLYSDLCCDRNQKAFVVLVDRKGVEIVHEKLV